MKTTTITTSTQHKKQNSHSVRHRRARVCQKSPLGHRFGRRHGHRFFSSPRKKICSPKKIETFLWRLGNPCPAKAISNKKAKFESRTGQNVAAASAASNTERAIEAGGRAAAERLLGAARQQRYEAIEQQKKAEKEASEKTRECEGHVNLVRDLTCEKGA